MGQWGKWSCVVLNGRNNSVYKLKGVSKLVMETRGGIALAISSCRQEGMEIMCNLEGEFYSHCGMDHSFLAGSRGQADL